jgi:hypothetical protein
MTGRVTGNQSDTTLGQIAELGKKKTAGSVGGTVYRRSRESNLQLIALQSQDLVTAGTGLDI